MSEEEIYVKTYDLVTGEIMIGNVNHIVDENKKIECWRGTDEYRFENEENFNKIKSNTMIWDKRRKRYVFAYGEKMSSGCACFSTIVIDTSNYLSTLLVDDEKVKYCWDWD